jgi:hypothetical protein
MKRIVILTAAAAMMLAGCATVPTYERAETYLTRAAKPVKVLSVSNPGGKYTSVTFIDARGRVFTVDADSLWSLAPGDVIR